MPSTSDRPAVAAPAQRILCPLDAIPEGEARGFRIGGRSLLAVHRNGRVYAYINSCPHLGVELNWLEHQFLDHSGALLQCATHGALFRIDSGECVAGPCHGRFLEPVACRIEGDQVVLDG